MELDSDRPTGPSSPAGTPSDDTYVALGAGLALVVTGVIDSETLFGTLGDEIVWLLICAFVLAAAVTRTGLAGRAAAFLVTGARTVRQLVQLTTAALVVTAFAVPATSGRAALAVPVFLALARSLEGRRRLVVMLALLFPTVILLSAVATLIGAGAHLITVSVLWEATGEQIGFTQWLLLGLPLAVVTSHLAAEAVLLTTTRRADRRGEVRLTAEQTQQHSESPVTGPLSPAAARCALLLVTVVALWCSEPLHRVPPAVVALIGAVVAASPALGTVRLKDALRTVPWSLLLFMAATMAMGVALSESEAAEWLVSGLPGGDAVPGWLFLAAVIAVSTAAHLVLQSRSARSSVLVPLVIAAALAAGVNPVAAALASTAAAGFCQTLPASAKPVAHPRPAAPGRRAGAADRRAGAGLRRGRLAAARRARTDPLIRTDRTEPRMLSRVVVAPSGFKESLSAEAAAEAIADGVRRTVPGADIDLIPLVDGGEGTAQALAAATGGRLVPVTATGPVGDRLESHFALLGTDGRPDVATAVVEMAAVAGLSLVPRSRRDPGGTTTYGVGELIRATLDSGVRRVVVGCGDSGTSDGGAGALQALGARLLDGRGRELPPGGRALGALDRIDATGLDPRLAGTELLVACNPFNVLCGPSGVARVFGPQKGATPEQVDELSAVLEHWAAGLAALGAPLLPRFEVLLGHVDLDARLAAADLVITAEGALDRQTSRGKVPAEVARRAKHHGRPVLALAGTLGEAAHEVRGTGADAYSGILPGPATLPEALLRGREYLADAAERALHMVLLGSRLSPPQVPQVMGTQRPSTVR